VFSWIISDSASPGEILAKGGGTLGGLVAAANGTRAGAVELTWGAGGLTVM
jgi:hypothetical protein